MAVHERPRFVLGGHRHVHHAPSAAMPIVREIGGNTKEVVATMGVAGEGALRAQKPVVALLQEVVRQRPVAGDARQVGPHQARRAVVERAERVLVHLEGLDRPCRHAVEATDVDEGHVTRKHVGASYAYERWLAPGSAAG